jgi:hypothetical protein
MMVLQLKQTREMKEGDVVTGTKRQVAVWLLAMLLMLGVVFAMSSVNSATTDDAHAIVSKAGG